jgi:hypothetical protein
MLTTSKQANALPRPAASVTGNVVLPTTPDAMESRSLRVKVGESAWERAWVVRGRCARQRRAHALVGA